MDEKSAFLDKYLAVSLKHYMTIVAVEDE